MPARSFLSLSPSFLTLRSGQEAATRSPSKTLNLNSLLIERCATSLTLASSSSLPPPHHGRSLPSRLRLCFLRALLRLYLLLFGNPRALHGPAEKRRLIWKLINSACAPPLPRSSRACLPAWRTAVTLSRGNLRRPPLRRVFYTFMLPADLQPP